MIHLNVDGHRVEVKEDASVLDAAREAGVYVPTLCHQPDLAPFGGCRLCIVEIEGSSGFPASCTTQAREGMVVRTDTEKVRELRKRVLELLLTEHPSACLICQHSSGCWEHHECTGRAEITTGCNFCPNRARCGLQEVVEHVTGQDGPLVDLPSLYKNIPIERRDPFIDRDDNLCILCGRCVRACADLQLNYTLEFVNRGTESRVGTAFNRTLVDAGCCFCGKCVDVCPTGSISERVRRWDGVADRYVPTTCSFCSTGCQFDLGVKDDRVIEALPRKEGEVNLGDACVRGRFAVVEFNRSVRRLKTPLVRRKGELAEVPWQSALEAAAEGIKRFKPERSALLYSGSCTNEDIYTAHKFARDVLKTSHVDSSLRLSYAPLLDDDASNGSVARASDLSEAGAVLVLGADPDFSHPVLALKLKRAVTEGSARLVIVGPHATGLSPYATCEVRHAPGAERSVLGLLQKRLGKAGSEGCSEDLERAAGILEEASSVVVVYGTGLMRRLDGVANRDLVSEIAGALPAKVLPLLSAANDRGAREIGAFFGCSGLTAPEILAAARTGELDLLYLVGEDLWPGECKTKFVVVQDMFLPAEAGKIANVVFPAASFVEMDGTYTNLEGRIQRIRRAVQPAVVSKPDWEILSTLARELELPGFDPAEPSEIMAELANHVPFYKGTTYEALEKEGSLFGRPRDGRAARSPEGSEPRRAPRPERTDREYPFYLMAEFDESAYKATPLGSEVRGIQRLEQAGKVALSLSDAEAMGIGPEAPVHVISRRGRVTARAVLSVEVEPGTARMVSRCGEASPSFVLDLLLDPASKAMEEICAVRIEKM